MYIGFIFNWHIQCRASDPNLYAEKVREGYEPLLKLLEKYGIKANHFMTGVTELHLDDQYPTVVEKIKRGVSSGQYELGTYTYNHPVIPLIPYEETFQQIKLGLDCDERVWGFRPKGFLLPELAWDPILPKVLRENGVEWVVVANSVYKESCPNCKDEELFRSTRIEGVEGSLSPRSCGAITSLSKHL